VGPYGARHTKEKRIPSTPNGYSYGLDREGRFLQYRIVLTETKLSRICPSRLR